jgi:hypothetical protein
MFSQKLVFCITDSTMESSHGSPSLESGTQSEKSSRTPYDTGFVPSVNEAKPPREITGWKWMLVVVNPGLDLLSEVGSALCGAAPNMDTLIVGCVLCGIGGFGLYIGVMTLLAATTTLHERPRYVASTGLT